MWENFEKMENKLWKKYIFGSSKYQQTSTPVERQENWKVYGSPKDLWKVYGMHQFKIEGNRKHNMDANAGMLKLFVKIINITNIFINNFKIHTFCVFEQYIKNQNITLCTL